MPVIQITGGFLKSRKITFPSSKTLRPTLSQIREAVFSILSSQWKIENGKWKINSIPNSSLLIPNFLDLFAGSGIMAFEAASRGYSVTCIERHAPTCKAIQENIKNLNADVTLLCGDAMMILEKLSKEGKSFDIIYIDPPYHDNIYDKTLNKILSTGMLKPCGYIVIEHPTNVLPDFSKFEIIKQKKYSDKLITIVKSEKL